MGNSFNKPLNNLPNTIENLTLGNSYDIQLDFNTLNNLSKLNLGDSYNHELNLENSKIYELKLGKSFNSNIDLQNDFLNNFLSLNIFINNNEYNLNKTLNEKLYIKLPNNYGTQCFVNIHMLLDINVIRERLNFIDIDEDTEDLIKLHKVNKFMLKIKTEKYKQKKIKIKKKLILVLSN